MSILPPQLPPTFLDTSPVANGLALTRDQLGFFSRLVREAGDVCHFALTDGITYLINDPALIREILVVQEKKFRKWAFHRTLEVFGTGLLGSEGELHRQMRQIVRPPLQQQRVSDYATEIVNLAMEKQKTWREGEINLTREMELLTLEIVGRLLFGVTVAERAEKILELSHTVQRLSERPNTSPDAERMFNEANAALTQIGKEILQERASRPGGNDLLSHLIAAREKDDQVVSTDQILQEMRTVIMAGHVTTAITIACAVWLLAQNPEVESRLHEEIDERLGKRSPTAADAAALPFCQMILLETLRLYPPVWILGRQTLSEVTLGRYTFPTGALILIVPWLLHRDSRYFREPEKFEPERWRNDARSGLPRCCYLPFSIGSRSCVGEQFAMMEATLTLALIAQRWKFRELPSKPDPGWTPQIVYWPRRGIRLLAQRRNP
jgi:cytochrome P450